LAGLPQFGCTLGILLHRTENRFRHPDSDLRGLGRRFQRRLAGNNVTSWLLANGEDCRWPMTVGGRPGLPSRLAHRYLDRVLARLVDDATVAQAFFAVLGRVLVGAGKAWIRRRHDTVASTPVPSTTVGP